MSLILRDRNKLVTLTSTNRLSRETPNSNVKYDLEVNCKVKESLLPYRNSTMPQTLSSRLKKSETLPADGWQNPRLLFRMSSCGNSHVSETKTESGRTDLHDIKLKSSQERSVDNFRERKNKSQVMHTISSTHGNANEDDQTKVEQLHDEYFNPSLPPPLPPKRTSSRRVEKPCKMSENFSSKITKSSETTQPGDESSLNSVSPESSFEDSDLLVALQKISLRLNELQVEKSPVLGHYSALYRMDQHAWRSQTNSRGNSSPNWNTCMPGLHNLPIRPRRSAYTNLI